MPTFPSPSDIFSQYTTILKSLRPDININDPSGEAIIRGKVLAGIISGLYGDQQMVDNDTYLQDARPEALDRRGADLGLPRQPSTPSISPDILFTGTPGSTAQVGLTLIYIPTGVLYTLQVAVTLDATGNGHGNIQANVNGQIGNVVAGDTLQIVSPPPGFTSTVTLVQTLADGTDIESDGLYRGRLILRFQRPPSGGNSFDYPAFAFQADPSVRTALIRRFGRGLGTVDVYITTGTTDVDTAINQGLSIVRVPSSTLITTVQNYYNAWVPLTDCPGVFGPTEIPQAVTVRVNLAAGLILSSIPADPVYNILGLTVQQLIVREVSRVLYKVPVGGRSLPGYVNGFVVASDIEYNLDIYLSAVTDSSGQIIGKVPILVDQEVNNLDGANTNRQILANQLVVPGNITVVLGV
jgi:uncharacterized phage protein gp47/JayE